jgi:hypothetical protein
MGTGLGVNEGGVAGSVGSLDLDIGFDYIIGCGGRSCGSRKARAHGERYKVTPSDIAGLVFLIFGHGFF